MKGLELDGAKSKQMKFRKVGGGRKNREFEWNGGRLEIVRKLCYLGYKMRENNENEDHVKKSAGKARPTPPTTS